VLVTNGINDPWVDSWQAVKMAARLQGRIDYDAGHGMGSTKPQNEQLNADMQSFFLWQFGDPWFHPKSAASAMPGRNQ
jgi:prolyl oligopeptidase